MYFYRILSGLSIRYWLVYNSSSLPFDVRNAMFTADQHFYFRIHSIAEWERAFYDQSYIYIHIGVQCVCKSTIYLMIQMFLVVTLFAASSRRCFLFHPLNATWIRYSIMMRMQIFNKKFHKHKIVYAHTIYTAAAAAAAAMKRWTGISRSWVSYRCVCVRKRTSV